MISTALLASVLALAVLGVAAIRKARA